MYQNIPEELKALRQWVCWRLEDIGSRKPTKVPYDPRTNKLASVVDPDSWCDFDTAVAKVVAGGYSGIGFVFTVNDDYTFVDLDDPSILQNGNANPSYQADYDRQIKLFKELDSYAEISPSGKGLHIIVRGSVPSGRRRSFIELYSSGRYATFTGNVYNKKPIINCQEKITQLWEQMGSHIITSKFTGDGEERHSDDEIIRQAKAAVNGDKFTALLEGRWNDIYPSQSEADFAFIDIVAFYTQNRSQIERIFKSSSLGKRDKAKRSDYIARMINFSFDRMLPPIDFDGFKNAIEQKVNENQLQLKLNAPQKKKRVIKAPPGLIGELAQFIYAAAPRPVPEIALAGALGLMAGICGRAYNVSNTGLNQYILLLAKTGMGKEGMAAGIDKLMNAIRFQVPTASEFIGPSHISSGQALVRYVGKKSRCFVSILGEFGKRIEMMADPRANMGERALLKILLELYNKSGATDVFRPSIYADSDKDVKEVNSPAFTLLGESTPHSFYKNLNEDMITDGLLPRFTMIEYEGERPELNKAHANEKPSTWLVDKFATLIANVETIMHANKVIIVNLDSQAEKMMDEFDTYATRLINQTTNEIVLNLWNRAHVKALKVAALIAVGVNMYEPVINAEYAQWAIDMVQADISALSHKFETGEIGHNTLELKQGMELIRIIQQYLSSPYEKVKHYDIPEKMHYDKIIPYAYINKRLASNAAFRSDRQGATIAMKRALQTLLDSDKIREVSKQELILNYGTMQRTYVVKDLLMLE